MDPFWSLINLYALAYRQWQDAYREALVEKRDVVGCGWDMRHRGYTASSSGTRPYIGF